MKITKITKNFGVFGVRCGKERHHFYLVPTIELILLKDEYFTNGSWMLMFRLLHYFFIIGYTKLKNDN